MKMKPADLNVWRNKVYWPIERAYRYAVPATHDQQKSGTSAVSKARNSMLNTPISVTTESTALGLLLATHATKSIQTER